jgi:hypothetical protein
MTILTESIQALMAVKRACCGLEWPQPPETVIDTSPRSTPHGRSFEHAFQQFHECSRRHREHATASRCQQQSRLQQRRVDQWQSHHVAGWDQRLAWAAELEADAAIHVSESLHRLDRVRNQSGIEIE